VNVLIVYESMYGNTRRIAEHIALGMHDDDVTVVPVAGADARLVGGADLLVVGAPTHAHGLSRPVTRADATAKAATDLTVEPGAEGDGVREWLDGPTTVRPGLAAAFDTRVDGASLLTGRASRAIDRQLRRHDHDVVAEPESFLVDRHNHLLPGEAERARGWGAAIRAVAEAMQPAER
jgi:hypothetical protein